MKTVSKSVPITIAIVISIFIMIFSSIFIGVGALFGHFMTEAYDATTEGVVTELVPGGDGFQAKYQFAVDGVTYDGCSSATTSSKNLWIPGRKITIHYNSQNPKENDDVTSTGLGQMGKWIFMIIGIIGFVVSIVGGVVAVVIINNMYSKKE